MEIKGLVALVSGGASGLGEATSRHLVGRGARVSICDVVEEKGRQLAGELGDSALFCRMDVTDETSVRAAVRSTVDRFGAVHAAISCAGVATPGKVLGREGPMDIQSFNRVVQINLVGTMNVIRFAAEQMAGNPPNEDGERGVLINTASIAGYEGQIGQAAYASSKAGVIGATLPVARELAQHGIRVVTIAPGMFETPMMAGMSDKVRESLLAITLFPKRLGKPPEFARLVAHIIDNPMLNGECIRLDGGVRMGAR
jgi:3-hydroxyacyl-CoA dehydrogenase / 3-hydroxy-2-methylbutyryl-CoA dehydrogenase